MLLLLLVKCVGKASLPKILLKRLERRMSEFSHAVLFFSQFEKQVATSTCSCNCTIKTSAKYGLCSHDNYGAVPTACIGDTGAIIFRLFTGLAAAVVTVLFHFYLIRDIFFYFKIFLHMQSLFFKDWFDCSNFVGNIFHKHQSSRKSMLNVNRKSVKLPYRKELKADTGDNRLT